LGGVIPALLGGKMEYPRFVFLSPGPNKCQGGTYDTELVQNESERKAAIIAGFSDDVLEAIKAYKVAKEAVKSAENVKEPIEVEAARRGRPPKKEGVE
jgi:hypothetical protein